MHYRYAIGLLMGFHSPVHDWKGVLKYYKMVTHKVRVVETPDYSGAGGGDGDRGGGRKGVRPRHP